MARKTKKGSPHKDETFTPLKPGSDLLIKVFDKKTNKNVYISQKKLRKISSDIKFTDEDRYQVAKKIKKFKGGLMVTPKRAKRGY